MPSRLRRDKPSLIYCNLSAYGADGPMRNKPGYDPLMQACGGIMSITGHRDQEPVRVGPSMVDSAAGMWSVIGILSALHRRHLTGEGAEVGTSLFETAVGWCGLHIATYSGHPQSAAAARDREHRQCAVEGIPGERRLDRHRHRQRQSLGEFLHVPWAIRNGVDDPDFRTNPDRVRNRERCNRLIAEVIATDDRASWQAKLDAANIPVAPLLTLDEVIAHPQTVATGMVQEAPDGHFPMVGLPVQFDGVRPPLRTLPPKLGAQTDRVLPVPAKETVPS